MICRDESPDPIGEALHTLRMSSVFYCRSEFAQSWSLELPEIPDSLMFHIATSGTGYIEVAGYLPQALQPGQLALVPHGRGHRLTSQPGRPGVRLFDVPREPIGERYEVLRLGDGPPTSTVICGAVYFTSPVARHLTSLLPGLILIDAWTAPQSDWILSTIRLMGEEARSNRPGGEAVITRLADVLVVQAIRSWIAQDPEAQTGWLAALRDPHIGRAIAGIHRDPARPWTVSELAAQAAMSRSAFSARFTELMGEPAMHYLARWRMRLAYAELQMGLATVADVAEKMGYQSEAAFSRAFRRILRTSPGAVRKTGFDQPGVGSTTHAL